MSKKLVLFSNCRVVSGVKRSTICDLQRGRFELIPNSMGSLFEQKGYFDPIEIREKIESEEEQKVLDSYINFLLEKEFTFWCDEDELSLFPDLDLSWDFPAIISNSIIDYGENSNHDIELIVNELNSVGCQFILIRAYSTRSIEFWINTLSFFQNSSVSSIELITPYNKEYTLKECEILIDAFPKVRSITISGSPKENQNNYKSTFITFLSRVINSDQCCGVISPKKFMVNEKLFTESQTFNNCLNRKISIDIEGNIKNCPSMRKSFGRLNKGILLKIAEDENFKKLWFINKNQTDICKICEFRYVCTDCRAFIEEQNVYSKPIKCNYDPFEAKWN